MNEGAQIPACPKCNSKRKEFVSWVIEKKDSPYPMMAIACFDCGSVVNILPLQEMRGYYEDLSKRISRIEEKLGLPQFQK